MKQLLELFLSFINIWSLGSLLRNRLSDLMCDAMMGLNLQLKE